MAHTNTPSFTTNSTCYSINDVVSFTNATQMTKDSMFNKIGLVNYSGSNKFYTWNFGDGSAVSNLMNPTHTYTAGGVYTTTLTTTIEGWAGNCTRTYMSSVSVGLAVNSTTITNVNCNGGNNGSFTAISQLRTDKLNQEIELKILVNEIIDSLSIISIMKTTIQELVKDKEVQIDVIKLGLKTSANYLLEKVVGRNRTVKGFLASILIEKITNSLINNNSVSIISGLTDFFNPKSKQIK